jgi:hypothetical protein
MEIHAKTLNLEQQKQTHKLLKDHLHVVFNYPCKSFPGYPFAWKEGESKVYFTAIIEHFEEAQEYALAERCNRKLRKMNFNDSHQIWALECMTAKYMRRNGGGIQFKARSSLYDKDIHDIIKEVDHANLWGHVKSVRDVLDHCQIRFHVEAFGATDAKVVSFKAYDGVPIVLMMWLLRQLECRTPRDPYGFGQVIIVHRNGLPDAGDDHDLHFKSGLIFWE